MSSFAETRNAKLKAKGEGGRVSVAQARKFPTLASMLNGIVDQNGTVVLPAYSLALWASEEGIGFALSTRGAKPDAKETWFGSCNGCDDPLAAIEVALTRGEVTVKVGAKIPF